MPTQNAANAANTADTALRVVTNVLGSHARTNRRLWTPLTALGQTSHTLRRASTPYTSAFRTHRRELTRAVHDEYIDFRNWHLIARYITLGADPDMRIRGQSLLHLAVSHGEELLVNVLLRHGANPNASNPLLAAALYPNHQAALHMITALLRVGADPNGSDILTPLQAAISTEQPVAVIDALLRGGADPNIGTYGGSPLVRAIRRRDVAVIKRLLDAGAVRNASARAAAQKHGTWTIRRLI